MTPSPLDTHSPITDPQFSLDDLVNAVTNPATGKDWILALMEENIIQPITQPITTTTVSSAVSHDGYLFNSVTLTTVRRASRLQRDFDASPKAIGLILSLLDELHGLRQLRRQVAVYHDLYEVE